MKILVVEDDRSTAALLSEVLRAQYYTVDIATDGQLGLELATLGDYELLLLDLLIPKLDGITLCRKLRTYGYQKAILLLTVKNSSADIVRGLDAGADDYVVKPYNLSELLARIRALLRRGETHLTPTILCWGNLCVNPVSAEVTYAGEKLSLSPKEYSLLGLFLRNPQRVFSRSELIDRLWSIDASPSEGTVTNLIKDLRHKLKAAGMGEDLLETVYGLGYRLKAVPKPTEDSPERKKQTATALTLPQQKLASVNQILKRYQETFAKRVTVLEEVVTALRSGNLSQTLHQNAIQEAHKLAGALGSFGYEKGSLLAQTIEYLLRNDEISQPQNESQLSCLVVELKQELTQPPVPLTLPSPKTNRVLVIDDDVSFTAQLQANAAAWGVEVEVVTEYAIAQTILAQYSPQAILLNLSLQNSLEYGLTVLRELKEQLPTVPILAIAQQDSLSYRVAVSRFGIGQFLHKPIAIAQVFEAIDRVLLNSQTPAANVMILDDDPLTLEMLRQLLQPWGLQITTLHNPQHFWEVLTATQPELLVMDLEMPEFNGIDLCRVVRQDPQWGNLPILVVTAHTRMESIQQVFAAGADDFISKPVVGPELVTRVISRIDRSRVQQKLETLRRRMGK